MPPSFGGYESLSRRHAQGFEGSIRSRGRRNEQRRSRDANATDQAGSRRNHSRNKILVFAISHATFIDRVEVGDGQIRITGRKKALGHAVGRYDAQQAMPAPNIEREWRTQQDSNLRPLPSEGSALSS
jgi:hypothetical protein